MTKRKRLDNKQKLFKRMISIATSHDGMILSNKYITAKTKYTFKCKEGHTFPLTSDKLYSRGDWCPFCAGRYGDFQSKYKHIIEDIQHGVMLSNYINATTKIKCKCSNGHPSFEMLPTNLNKGKWCKYCNHTSHGEQAIINFLTANSIPFKREYRFEDLKGRRNALPFDFAIFNKDSSLMCLIEYDGEQHFRPLRHSQTKEKNLKKYNDIVRNDKKKNEYCKHNNIRLIRISYFDVDERRILNLQRDINNILYKELFNK